MSRPLEVAALMGGLFAVLSSASLGASPLLSQDGQGRVLYDSHCAGCHGPDGRGDGKQALSLSPRPGNLISAQTSAKPDRDLLKIIADGRPHTAMEGWKDRLSEEEQRAIVAYVRSLIRFTRSATPPPPDQ
jgi:mono/diheme cytochrome c family protein